MLFRGTIFAIYTIGVGLAKGNFLYLLICFTRHIFLFIFCLHTVCVAIHIRLQLLPFYNINRWLRLEIAVFTLFSLVSCMTHSAASLSLNVLSDNRLRNEVIILSTTFERYNIIALGTPLESISTSLSTCTSFCCHNLLGTKLSSDVNISTAMLHTSGSI